MSTGSDMAKAEGAGKGPRFLRRRGFFFALLALPFLGSIAGALTLAAIYHWPHVSVPTYYFIVRPAFVWFGAVAPFMAFGLVAVRWRWFLAGCVVWMAAFLATQEALPLLKPFGGRARAQFWSASMAFQSYLAANPSLKGRVDVPLRLVTWNIQGGALDAYRSAQQLASLEPDIVLMQEFMPSHMANMSEALQDLAFFADYKVVGAERGILSRWPFEELKDDVLPAHVATAWRVNMAPGLSVVIINVHLTPQPLRTQVIRGLDRREMEESIARAQKELEAVGAALAFYSRRGTVILAGDFNLPPSYPDLRRARGRFIDCFGASGHGWGQTAPAMLPALRVDQIYVPPGSRVYYATAVPTRWSDHYMTLAEVAVPVMVGPGAAAAGGK